MDLYFASCLSSNLIRDNLRRHSTINVGGNQNLDACPECRRGSAVPPDVHEQRPRPSTISCMDRVNYNCTTHDSAPCAVDVRFSSGRSGTNFLEHTSPAMAAPSQNSSFELSKSPTTVRASGDPQPEAGNFVRGHPGISKTATPVQTPAPGRRDAWLEIQAKRKPIDPSSDCCRPTAGEMRAWGIGIAQTPRRLGPGSSTVASHCGDK